MIINASRIGAQGTGLYNFTKSVIHCLNRRVTNLSILAADMVDFGSQVKKVPMPDWVTMTPKVSIIRPILWYIYVNLFINKNISYLLSTTHHPIPGIKHQIITIHDLRLLYYPDNFGQYIYFKIILKKQLKNMDAIFTVSHQTKKMIQKHYNFDPERIFIIPNCVDTSIFTPGSPSKETSEKYLLSVGATWQHKNIQEIINNSDLWADKYNLKIVAGRGTYRKYLTELVNTLNLTDKVEFINYVSLQELVSLYQKATALIYPSKMEGFGIPPLEAMACGIPVILSDIPVFQENFQDIPIYIALNNKNSLEKAINSLEDITVIKLKRERGIERAKTFSETNLCKALFNAIENVWPEIKIDIN
jgi:glycosyltransferase involved in cell wall biosynthesis